MNVFQGISQINRGEIIALADVLSLALSEGLDSDDQNMLGSLLTVVGDLITAFASRVKVERKGLYQ